MILQSEGRHKGVCTQSTAPVPAKKKPTEHAVRVNISLPPDDLALLDRLAEVKYDGNRSKAIIALAREAHAALPRKRATKK